MKKIIGTIMTVIIGGVVYNINSADVVKHFAEDTGLTQQQAEQYVNNVSENDIIPFDKLGADFIEEGQETLNLSSGIDCINYDYEWESASLTCYDAKTQLEKMGKDEISLGQAYKKLGSESASKDDISSTVKLIGQYNLNFESEVISVVMDQAAISESKLNNSYNKALLQAALESD